jgi:hypothetical protein
MQVCSKVLVLNQEVITYKEADQAIQETGFDPPQVQETHPLAPLGPPGIVVTGYRGRIRGIKQQCNEAAHLPPSSNRYRISSVVPPLRLMPSWRA